MNDQEFMEYHKANIEAIKAYRKNDKNKTPSNSLTAQIIRWFEQKGGAARRVNTMGQYDTKIGRYRPSGMRRGYEDIDATYPMYINGIKIGLKIAIEVKIKKDSQSEYQIERMNELRAAGGVYIVAKKIEQTISDIYAEVDKIYKAIKDAADSPAGQ